MASILEAVMLTCFGFSWPISAYKAYQSQTAKGASWQFIVLIELGYSAGVAAKLVSGNVNWVLLVYLVNMVCVGANAVIYLRNRRLDQMREAETLLPT